MRKLASLTAGLLLTVSLSAPVHADETIPGPPAPVYECAQAEALAAQFDATHRSAVIWQQRALTYYSKILAKQAKIQRMRATIEKMRGRINRQEERLHERAR